MNIAILGGAFNPPHWGHLAIAQQALDFCPLDQVWLMPAFHYDPAFNKTLLDFNHRLKMTKFLTRPKIRVSAFEKNIKGVSHTYKVMRALAKKYPLINFSFLMGSDNLAKFDQWYRSKDLLKMCPFYIFPREKISKNIMYKNMKIIHSPWLKTTPISSTLIRQVIKQNQPLRQYVPPAVWQYIKNNRLYAA